MATTYETLVVFNPNLEKEALTSLLEGFKEVIARRGGSIITERDLGKKKFAFTVKKFSTGYYYLLYFTADPGAVFDLERSFKHSEEVLKFISLKLDEKELKHSLATVEIPAVATAPPATKEEGNGQLQ